MIYCYIGAGAQTLGHILYQKEVKFTIAFFGASLIIAPLSYYLVKRDFNEIMVTKFVCLVVPLYFILFLITGLIILPFIAV